MITHLEPDILEYEVKWTLGSVTMSKARKGDGIPAKLLKSPKIMLLKYCTQYVSKFGKLSRGPRMGSIYRLSNKCQVKYQGENLEPDLSDSKM